MSQDQAMKYLKCSHCDRVDSVPMNAVRWICSHCENKGYRLTGKASELSRLREENKRLREALSRAECSAIRRASQGEAL